MEDIIKQKAEEYATNRCLKLNEQYGACYDAFLAGAHSRDAEIQHLEEELKTLSVLLEKNGVIKFANLHNQMEIDLLRLRNPWLSVDTKLPDKESENPEFKGYSVEVIGMAEIPDFENCTTHRHIYNCRMSLDRDEQIWIHGDSRIICDKPDYWMPVPNTARRTI